MSSRLSSTCTISSKDNLANSFCYDIAIAMNRRGQFVPLILGKEMLIGLDYSNLHSEDSFDGVGR